jgi:hypothetical protein
MIDEMSATQVRERAAMAPTAIISRLTAVAPKGRTCEAPDAGARAMGSAPQERSAVRCGAVALRLPGGHHLHPGHVDAPPRHQPCDRAPQWESQQAFADYGPVLMPILRKVGIDPGTPDVMPIHNLVG